MPFRLWQHAQLAFAVPFVGTLCACSSTTRSYETEGVDASTIGAQREGEADAQPRDGSTTPGRVEAGSEIGSSPDGGLLPNNDAASDVRPTHTINDAASDVESTRVIDASASEVSTTDTDLPDADLADTHTLPVCTSSTCEHGGTCSIVNGAIFCKCADGFRGDRCEQDVDECGRTPAPCSPGGACKNTVGSYTCVCADAWLGPDCSTPRFELLPASLGVTGISANGMVIVGSTGTPTIAARYAAGQQTTLGTLLNDSSSVATAASNNGEVVVGYSLLSGVSERHPVRWDGASIKALPMLSGAKSCEANDITPDGRVISGMCDGSFVRWVNDTIENLDSTSGQSYMAPTVVGDDGQSVLVTGSVYPNVASFRWVEGRGVSQLANVAGSHKKCLVNDLTSDGKTGSVTCVTSGSTAAAAVWTEQDGLALLTETVPSATVSARGITGDGSVIVGADSSGALYWDAQRVPHALRSWLPETVAGASNVAWGTTAAVAISKDGRVAVVTGGVANESRTFLVRR